MVHAPQNPMPHPTLVPVRRSSSRNTHKSGTSGGEETSTGLSFSSNAITRQAITAELQHRKRPTVYIGQRNTDTW
jgi:hypothetical protein